MQELAITLVQDQYQHVFMQLVWVTIGLITSTLETAITIVVVQAQLRMELAHQDLVVGHLLNINGQLVFHVHNIKIIL